MPAVSISELPSRFSWSSDSSLSTENDSLDFGSLTFSEFESSFHRILGHTLNQSVKSSTSTPSCDLSVSPNELSERLSFDSSSTVTKLNVESPGQLSDCSSSCRKGSLLKHADTRRANSNSTKSIKQRKKEHGLKLLPSKSLSINSNVSLLWFHPRVQFFLQHFAALGRPSSASYPSSSSSVNQTWNSCTIC
ncbi:hypothetical protein SPOG_00564 [Schizosaccharomyces cryophilus OY26]|uniref:Uncharacterized protein n=1 Tax=Schizosaccharomyces cryophilus (strain OY26 / ATCC MYA-4695 / CBS 11777 / NBRC 106824 / NRRL Y48691) TaxID=653667 RepID=S9VYL6_SCHCR|nr:uncharacterized protein SPOG_00564 [Schizosaccharomyces cryophilus OY26]EPY50900.1 hypothetical protein SPOG_00564 [Schizosaccharomyces cryophilus OY26]